LVRETFMGRLGKPDYSAKAVRSLGNPAASPMNNATKHVLWLLACTEDATPRQMESFAEWFSLVRSTVKPEVAKLLLAACEAHRESLKPKLALVQKIVVR
jgi:hypothetical protein